MHHIGVGEPKEIRLAVGRGLRAFVQRPKFSRPARRKIGRGMNRDSFCGAGFRRCFARERSGAVLTVIINNDNRELAGIILFGKRADGLCDGSSFVARGNHGGDARPV